MLWFSFLFSRSTVAARQGRRGVLLLVDLPVVGEIFPA
jgi:hypothetical protein